MALCLNTSPFTMAISIIREDLRLAHEQKEFTGISELKKRVASNVPIVPIDVTSGPLTVICD